MNKFLVTADIHTHLYSRFATPDTTYGSSRLKDIVMVLLQIRDYALVYGYEYLVIVGDLFHIRGVINAHVFTIIYDLLDLEFKQKGIHIILVAGNHDQANRQGTVTSLKGLEKVCTVITEPCSWDNCVFIPFSEHRDVVINGIINEVTQDTEYLFIHAGIQGAIAGSSEYQPTEELLLENIPDVDEVFLGHYHKPQELRDRVHYCGSPLHLSFEDAGQQKGFWSVDDSIVNFIPTTYPTFNIVHIKTDEDLRQFVKSNDGNNFYWLKCTINIHTTQDNVIATYYPPAEAYQPRVMGLDQMTDEQSLQSYITYKKPELDKTALLKYGLYAITRAKVLK